MQIGFGPNGASQLGIGGKRPFRRSLGFVLAAGEPRDP